MRRLLLILLAAGCSPPAPTPTPTPKPAPTASATPTPAPERLVIAFWNVQNLFDAEDDPRNEGDDEYLPAKGWTAKRYAAKLDHLAEAIAAIAPHALGLCEVENRAVLEALVGRLKARGLDFSIAHRESPDTRGIDVALLARAPLVIRSTDWHLPEKMTRTREILEVGLQASRPLTLLVNHWPARGEDGTDTSYLRERAARSLKRALGRDALAMGDFNDEPWDDSLKIVGGENLMAPLKGRGTHKYRREWKLYDQFISRLQSWRAGEARIHAPPELTRESGGPKPYRRESSGWVEGYSDHYPVVVELIAP